MSRCRSIIALVVSAVLAACGPGPDAPAGLSGRDTERNGLFRDFFGGKYDTTGHPINAQVYEAEKKCHPQTGAAQAEGWGASPDGDAAGLLCKLTTRSLDRGPFTLNVRGLTPTPSTCAVDAEELALTIRVTDASGAELATKNISRDNFRTALTYQNLTLAFTHYAPGPVKVEVQWPGVVAVRLDYLEVFPAARRVVLAPPSGVPAANATFQIDFANPPLGATVGFACTRGSSTPNGTASCSGVAHPTLIEDLVQQGVAKREDGDFSRRYRLPTMALVKEWGAPLRAAVQLVESDWARDTARVTILAQEPPCAFTAGARKVLLTGFEPFPADSTGDNSSEQAVLGFDERTIPGISVMRLVLPVEWDTAATMLARVVDRCRPEIVVAFGQGRNAVDIETTAYNVKDGSDLGGGTPDNRGITQDNVVIVKGGAAKLTTRLPVSAIVSALSAAGVTTQSSDDPGRYICNNLFYALLRKLEPTALVGGFVHLPHVARVDAAELKTLQTVVRTVVGAALQKLAPPASPN